MAAVVVTLTEAYSLNVDGKTSGLAKVKVVVNPATVVEGVTAVTSISVNKKAVVPSHTHMPTMFPAVAATKEVEQALT